MTPAARIAAAIALMDPVLAGAPVERELTRWARANRYAGSGDRAAIRDLVFHALRNLRTYAALGGAETGRGVMLGALLAQGEDPAVFFTGERFAPAPLGSGELPDLPAQDLPDSVALNVPDWLAPQLQAALGADYAEAMRRMLTRAPVFLRVNIARTTRESACEALAEDGITAVPVDWVDTAIEATENTRRIKTSRAYLEGHVEVQDAASQAVCALVESGPGRVLDFCAGGGGKALALAARGARVWAHDAAPERLRDLPVRAERAGVTIPLLTASEAAAQAPWDLIVTDVPCSGTGTWRRAPQAKWTLTDARLQALTETQSSILDRAARMAAPGGRLAYMTCSLLPRENDRQITAFLERHPEWTCPLQRLFTPLDGGDGMFLALLQR